MDKFKQQVTDYLNKNSAICAELMHEGDYVKDWESGGLPFEHKGVDSHGGEGMGDDFYSVVQIVILITTTSNTISNSKAGMLLMSVQSMKAGLS